MFTFGRIRVSIDQPTGSVHSVNADRPLQISPGWVVSPYHEVVAAHCQPCQCTLRVIIHQVVRQSKQLIALSQFH